MFNWDLLASKCSKTVESATHIGNPGTLTAVTDVYNCYGCNGYSHVSWLPTYTTVTHTIVTGYVICTQMAVTLMAVHIRHIHIQWLPTYILVTVFPEIHLPNWHLHRFTRSLIFALWVSNLPQKIRDQV